MAVWQEVELKGRTRETDLEAEAEKSVSKIYTQAAIDLLYLRLLSSNLFTITISFWLLK